MIAGVIQLDRDAAADTAVNIYGVRIANSIRSGTHDGHHLVQAFARHRQAARERALDEAAEVAEGQVAHHDGTFRGLRAAIASQIRKLKEG